MRIFGMDIGSVIFGLIIVLLLAIIPARIAKKKGYSFAAFYVFGIVLFIVALIVSLVMPDKKANRASELVSYKKLLDEGVISQEEFESKKRELLK